MTKLVFLALFVFTLTNVFAQTDELLFVNNERVTGEISRMSKGVIVIETSYSDDDFTIEWDQVKGLKSVTKFVITMSDATKYFGTLNSSDGISAVINDVDVGNVTVSMIEIVDMSSVDDGFWDRLSANIDMGFDLAKARTLRSFTINANVGYKAERWNANGSYYALRSNQDDVDEIHRTEGKLSFNYILGKKWYPNITSEWLSNTEQQLDVRRNLQAGMGRYLIRSNSAYWGLKIGANNNFERYNIPADDTVDPPVAAYTQENNSWEGFIGTDLDLFDMGDLSLYALITAYPSITEEGRWRTDATVDFKYDLPKDFYIKWGGSVNYDTDPAEGASELDYVMYTGFGWEW